jgi:hypothetical protein
MVEHQVAVVVVEFREPERTALILPQLLAEGRR